MRPTLSASLLSQLSELVAIQTGLHFPQERWGDHERGIAAAAPDFNFLDRGSCARWLLSAPLTRHMNEVLASHLSVGETYLFREKQSLGVFEEHILPKLLQSRRQNGRHLRIWSVGCSTGEEAYTIAILLDRLIPELKDWDITILATDFNPKFLRKAAQGVYGEWSFRYAPAWLRERYFVKRPDGSFEILPRIKKMVMFSYLNFADDVYPSLLNSTSAMDVIFCRNVLRYFTAHRARQVTGNFYHALAEGGWLIVSPTEASDSLLSSFTPVEFPGAFLFQKMVNAESHIQNPRMQNPPIQNRKSRVSQHQVLQPFMETEAASSPPLPVAQAVQLPVTQADERAQLRQSGQAQRGAGVVRKGDRRRQAEPVAPLSQRHYFAGARTARYCHSVIDTRALSRSRVRACPFCPGESTSVAGTLPGSAALFRECAAVVAQAPAGRDPAGSGRVDCRAAGRDSHVPAGKFATCCGGQHLRGMRP
jgi:chemotaxis protein methyltransferase CheR